MYRTGEKGWTTSIGGDFRDDAQMEVSEIKTSDETSSHIRVREQSLLSSNELQTDGLHLTSPSRHWPRNCSSHSREHEMSAGARPGWAKGVRKEPRIPGCKPVTVLGKDIFGNPFSQNTFTLEIAAYGARLRGLPPLAVDAVLYLDHGGAQARYRVVWIGEKNTEYEGHVGLECIERNKFIFGIEPSEPGLFYDEYKRVEAELHRSQDRYRSVVENSLGLIFTHDMSGVLLSVNPATARALGLEPNGWAGKSLAEFLAPSVRSAFFEYLERMQERRQDSGYARVIARDRKMRVWLYRDLAVQENGSPPYVIGHALDVTEQTKTGRKLQFTMTRLQKALAEVKTLKGCLPICAWCKKIRAEDGGWSELESYVTKHSDASFSHGICPDCLSKQRSANT
jgi:PAS domain S-box-containing protein